MATTLMRMSARQVMISKNLLEKKLLPALCANNIFHDALSNAHAHQHKKCDSNSCSIAHIYMIGARRMSTNKRNLNHTKSSATMDEENRDDESDIDSSDDEDDRNQVPSEKSHFWRRKMRTLHSHWDVNKDGILSFDDFKLWGERFSTMGHLTHKQKDEFQYVIRQMWEEQWGPITDPFNLFDVEKHLQKMHHVINDKPLRRKVHNFLPYLFKAVDKDDSGEISVQEFKLFFHCLGLDNDDAVISFAHIDTNEDGKISKKEFIKLGREFFLTDDPKRPSKHFWGPLVH